MFRAAVFVGSVAALCACRVERRHDPRGPASPSKAAATNTTSNASQPTLTQSPRQPAPAQEQQTSPKQERATQPSSEESQPPADPEAPVTPPPEDALTPKLRETPPGWRVFAFAGGQSIPEAFKKKAVVALGESSPIEIATRLTAELEALETTNAGPGAALRIDGKTIEVAALLKDSNGRSALVGGLRKTLQPVRLAEALYRAGGGEMWGSAGDELAERLDLPLGSLERPVAVNSYHQDLAFAVQVLQRHKTESLFSLYVPQEELAKALTAQLLPPDATNESRLPVFTVVINPENEIAVALSGGGEPFALPGSRGALTHWEDLVALAAEQLVIQLSAKESCSHSAADTLEQLRSTRSLTRAAQPLKKECLETTFLLLNGSSYEANLATSQLFHFESEAPEAEPVQVEPAAPQPSVPPPQPSTSPSSNPPAPSAPQETQ